MWGGHYRGLEGVDIYTIRRIDRIDSLSSIRDDSDWILPFVPFQINCYQYSTKLPSSVPVSSIPWLPPSTRDMFTGDIFSFVKKVGIYSRYSYMQCFWLKVKVTVCTKVNESLISINDTIPRRWPRTRILATGPQKCEDQPAQETPSIPLSTEKGKHITYWRD